MVQLKILVLNILILIILFCQTVVYTPDQDWIANMRNRLLYGFRAVEMEGYEGGLTKEEVTKYLEYYESILQSILLLEGKVIKKINSHRQR